MGELVSNPLRCSWEPVGTEGNRPKIPPDAAGNNRNERTGPKSPLGAVWTSRNEGTGPKPLWVLFCPAQGIVLSPRSGGSAGPGCVPPALALSIQGLLCPSLCSLSQGFTLNPDHVPIWVMAPCPSCPGQAGVSWGTGGDTQGPPQGGWAQGVTPRDPRVGVDLSSPCLAPPGCRTPSTAQNSGQKNDGRMMALPHFPAGSWGGN